MEYFLSISEAAEFDLREAFLWYEDRKNDLGLVFEKHIIEALKKIQENPLQTQIKYKQTRVAFLRKFPYGIHFNVFENEIIILAVFHTSRGPKNWTEK